MRTCKKLTRTINKTFNTNFTVEEVIEISLKGLFFSLVGWLSISILIVFMELVPYTF